MVKLRSQRFGKTKAPFYRIVATDSRNPRDGRFIEIVGTYNPLTNPATVTFDEEKVLNGYQKVLNQLILLKLYYQNKVSLQNSQKAKPSRCKQWALLIIRFYFLN